MSQRDLLHTGDLYFPNDPSIMTDQLKYLDRLYDFNQTRPTELKKREKLLKKMFAELGEGCYIEPPPPWTRPSKRWMRTPGRSPPCGIS